MQWLSTQLSYFDMSGAALLVIAGLTYGLFGWRLARFLVILDALIVGAVAGAWVLKHDDGMLKVAGMPSALIVVVCLPLLAWKFPAKANVGMAALAGFVTVELLLADFDWPRSAMIVLGLLGAGLAMALAVTLARQTMVVVTGIHGGWLCVAALAILAFDQSNAVGQMLHSFADSFTLITPAALVAFSAIMIFLQWSDMQSYAPEAD